MAEKLGSVEADGGVVVLQWLNLAAGDTGKPVIAAQYADKTAQAIGDGTVALEGSNDGSTWVPLTDTGGDVIALIAADGAMSVIRENPRYMRPAVTGGVATDVIIVGVGDL